MSSTLKGQFIFAEQELVCHSMAMSRHTLVNGNKAAVVLLVPKNGTITGFKFFCSYEAGAPFTWVGGIYTVDANGDPTATPYGGMTAHTKTVAGVGVVEFTFPVSATATAGDLVALVVEQTSVATSGVQISSGSGIVQRPYIAFHNGSSWARNGYSPIGALMYSGASEHVPGLFTSREKNDVAVSNPNELGNWFQVPWQSRLTGALLWVNPDDATSNFVVKLYDAAKSVVVSKSITAGQLSGAGVMGWVGILFDATTLLTKDVDYYLTVAPASGKSATVRSLVYMDLDAAKGTMSGASCYRVLKNGSTITPTTTEKASVFPVFDQIITGDPASVAAGTVAGFKKLGAQEDVGLRRAGGGSVDRGIR
jgi:hypothetical protein